MVYVSNNGIVSKALLVSCHRGNLMKVIFSKFSMSCDNESDYKIYQFIMNNLCEFSVIYLYNYLFNQMLFVNSVKAPERLDRFGKLCSFIIYRSLKLFLFY